MKFILRSKKIIDSKVLFTIDSRYFSCRWYYKKIATSLPNSDKTEEVKLDNLHVSQGWFDSSVSLGEQVMKIRETISNGLSVAAKVALPLSL
jgi:dihydroorotase